MYITKETNKMVSPSIYALRCLVVVTVIAAAATFLHLNNYRPSKFEVLSFIVIFENSKDIHRSILIDTFYEQLSCSFNDFFFRKLWFLIINREFFIYSFSEQTFLSCDRPCHHLDWPMICRVKLTLEVFQSLSK